jgi:hypothetical protein
LLVLHGTSRGVWSGSSSPFVPGYHPESEHRASLRYWHRHRLAISGQVRSRRDGRILILPH